jgi:hypothetical protein
MSMLLQKENTFRRKNAPIKKRGIRAVGRGCPDGEEKTHPEPPGIGGLRRGPEEAAGRVRKKRTSGSVSRTGKERQGEQQSARRRYRIKKERRAGLDFGPKDGIMSNRSMTTPPYQKFEDFP